MERIDPLGGEWKIVVSDEHSFGTDAVLLSRFTAPKRSENAIDLGSGCGIIPLLWAKGGAQNITAVEIQEMACKQINKSIELNEINGKITVINHDLRNIRSVLPGARADLVTMNPPYKRADSGILSECEADRIARFESLCTMEDVAECAAYLLRYGGKFALCHRPQRLSDVICALRKHKLEPKRLRFVAKKEGSAPWLFLLEARLGGGNELQVLPTLNMYSKDGRLTEEAEKLTEYRE